MSINSLFPAFIETRYTTPFTTHTQRFPCLAFSNSGFDDAGSFETHNAGSIAGDVMAEALIDLLADCVNPTTTYEDYTIYTLDDATATPKPVFGKVYTTVGTGVLTGVDRAVQQTFTFRTSNFGFMKWVQLDRHTNNSFGKFITVDTETGLVATALMDPDNAWAGRDGGRPALYLSASITLNSRLERKYL